MPSPPEFIESIERMWNKKAIQLIDEHKIDIKPNQFRISVFEDDRAENRKQYQTLMKIHNAPVVQILILYPQSKVAKTILRGLRYISSPKAHHDEDMLNPLVNGSVLHELKETGEGRAVWLRDNFEAIAALYSNLRKKREFEFTIKRTVIAKHKKSGIISKVVDSTNRNERDMMQEAWMKCSRSVDDLQKARDEMFESISKSTALVPVGYYFQAELVKEYLHYPSLNFGTWEDFNKRYGNYKEEMIAEHGRNNV